MDDACARFVATCSFVHGGLGAAAPVVLVVAIATAGAQQRL